MIQKNRNVHVVLLAVCLLSLLLPFKAEAVFLNPSSCTITTTAVAFGLYWGNVNLASTGTINVTCSQTVTTTVALDLGRHSASYAARNMASGKNTLRYNLYTSASHAFIWGDGTAGTHNVVGKQMIVYGSLPAGQKVSPGTYGDTVLVTVAW